MTEPVSIMAMASVSALGADEQQVWKNYKARETRIASRDFGSFSALVSSIDNEIWAEINALREVKNYKELDPSVLMAIYVARKAVSIAGWKSEKIGINIGSSRGSTHLFEKYHREFLETGQELASTLSSPTTTLGNLSSWVGHDLQSKGPTISHSIACSTALHGILNGIAWLNSGMSRYFLAGGSEASNTPFTVSQLKALRIYSERHQEFPCRTLDLNKSRNSMVLGEAAAVFCLEKGSSPDALAVIEGIGYATEPLTHNISISTDAECFQRSMRMALEGMSPEDIDVIVTHAPGTLKGDSSELLAIQKVFQENVPALTSNKWIIGHTLGASGAMSLEMALLMLRSQEFIDVPFLDEQKAPGRIRKVLINAVGFGGNAVSLIVSRDLSS
ncbi:MAG: beta-ketoacyl synthase N-terminal-like domain-containing protein [Lutimonas sp.]